MMFNTLSFLVVKIDDAFIENYCTCCKLADSERARHACLGQFGVLGHTHEPHATFSWLSCEFRGSRHQSSIIFPLLF